MKSKSTHIPVSIFASLIAEIEDESGNCENCGKWDQLEVGTGYCRECQKDWEKFDEKCFQEYLKYNKYA